jgi:hypothetical protein
MSRSVVFRGEGKSEGKSQRAAETTRKVTLLSSHALTDPRCSEQLPEFKELLQDAQEGSQAQVLSEEKFQRLKTYFTGAPPARLDVSDACYRSGTTGGKADEEHPEVRRQEWRAVDGDAQGLTTGSVRCQEAVPDQATGGDELAGSCSSRCCRC